ncbi:hypothetical protein BG000_011131 [Podila horticola]|nr:hypothetical protein BG000_011131 [Podila horticola]
MDWDKTPVNAYLPEFETIDPVLTSQLTTQGLISHRTYISDGFKRKNHGIPYRVASYQDAVESRFTELPLDGMIRTIAAAGDMFSNVLDIAR